MSGQTKVFLPSVISLRKEEGVNFILYSVLTSM